MADDGRSDSILISRDFVDEDCSTTSKDRDKTTSLSGSSAIALTINCTNTVTSTTDEINVEKRSTKAPSIDYEISTTLTPRMASSSTPDVIPLQNSSILSLKDIANLVRHAPPPLTILPVSNSHPLPSQSRPKSTSVTDDKQEYRSRKGSLARAHQRKGSTYTQRSKSVSSSINSNGHSRRHRQGKPRNSLGRKRDEQLTNFYQNAPTVTRMHVSRFSTDTTSSFIPYPNKGYFRETVTDISNHRAQKFGSEASFENVYNVDHRARVFSSNYDLDDQQLYNGIHNKHRTRSGTEWGGRYRSYGTSADDNEFLSNIYNKDNDPIISNLTDKNAVLSNGSYSNSDAKYYGHCTRNFPAYDSLTEGFQQLDLRNHSSKDAIRRMPATSKLNQNSHSDIPITAHVSKSLYEPYREDISFSCRGDTHRKKDNCNNNAFFSVSEMDSSYLTRKQVGYGRQDAVLPTSPSDPRFVDLSYFTQNSCEHRQDRHQFDKEKFRNEKILNRNLDEQRNSSRHVQMAKNDKRLYNDTHIVSSNGFRSFESRSHLPYENTDNRNNNLRCSEPNYERAPLHISRRDNLSPSIESTSSQSTWHSSSGDSGTFSSIPKTRNNSKDRCSLPDAQLTSSRLAAARERAAKRERSESKRETKGEHKQSAHFKSGRKTKSICQASEESSHLDSEIEEEMIRARNMDIPVKFNTTKQSSEQSNEPKLDPSAKSFAPLCRDANGNIFKIVSSKGVSFFHPHISEADSNPNYLIPPHDNETDTTSSENTEIISHVNQEPVQHCHQNDALTNSLWEMPILYPQVSSSNDINATSYFNSIIQASSTANCNLAAQMHANINTQSFAASPELTYSPFGHLSAPPIVSVGKKQTLITGLNETSTNDTGSSNNFTNDTACSNYPNFPHTGASVSAANSFPQISNQNYDCNLGQSHMTALQISDAPPDLNSTSHIPLTPFEVAQSLGNQQVTFQNQSGQPYPVLINETSPYFVQSPLSPFIQTSEINNQMYNVNPSSVNSPVILAINHMTPSPIGPFPENMPFAQVPTRNQMISPASFQTLTDNTSTLPEQSQPCASQPPIMNLQTYVALMDNSPADAMPNFFPSKSFPEEKPVNDDSKNQDCLMKNDEKIRTDGGKSIEMALIREVIEKFVETVRRTDKESPIPLTKRQFADVLCGTSPSIIDDVMTNHSNVNSENYKNKPNHLKDKSEKDANVKETQPKIVYEQSETTSINSVKSKNDHLEIPCPPGFENKHGSNFENSAFPIVFGFETEIESSIENSSIAPSGNRCESDSEESGFVTPTSVNDTEFRENSEMVNPQIVNPQLEICQNDERRDSIGKVSVEKRIDYFEKHKRL